jgi:2-phospho-L-lactate/phosphoenolpyruvate guanylyltransferase
MGGLEPGRGARRIWAAVPFRGPVGSKRRLAGLLDPAERERLSLAMLSDVLDALLQVDEIERVLLLTPAADADLWPRHERLVAIDEPPHSGATGDNVGLNGALHLAQCLAADAGVDGLLIVPADLPTIERGDLDAILNASTGTAVVIAPDRAGEGTNALMLSPPMALLASFGAASYARHRACAEAGGLDVTSIERPGLGLDLDTPADVVALVSREHHGRAATLLAEIGVQRRLEVREAAQARSTTI